MPVGFGAENLTWLALMLPGKQGAGMSYRVSHGQGMALILAAGFVWSLNGLLLRMIGDAGTWQVLFYRSIGMVPVLFLWVALGSGGQPFRALRGTGWAGVIGGMGLVFAFAGAIYSMQATSIANAVFLFAAAPLITAVMARPIPGRTGAACHLGGHRNCGVWHLSYGPRRAGAGSWGRQCCRAGLGRSAFRPSL